MLPIIIVRAQSEGETQAAAPAETSGVEQPVAEATAPEDESAPAAEPQQETEEGDTPADAPAAEGEASDDSGTTEEAAGGSSTEQPTSTPPVAEGSVLGEATSTEEVSRPEPSISEGSSATETEAPPMTTASSTEATSTPPVVEPQPVEEKFVLQPAVALHIEGSSLSADIELQNLTCKSCEKVLPDLDVNVYYTPWYPNDGPAASYDEANTHRAKQSIDVASLPNWGSHSSQWSADNIAPGRYYFVVEVDPADAHSAYYLFRSEFSI